MPRKQDLDVSGLDIDAATLETLLSVDPVAWRQEIEAIGKYLDEFGERVPRETARRAASDVAEAARLTSRRSLAFAVGKPTLTLRRRI